MADFESVLSQLAVPYRRLHLREVLVQTHIAIWMSTFSAFSFLCADLISMLRSEAGSKREVCWGERSSVLERVGTTYNSVAFSYNRRGGMKQASGRF